ncbi:HigA family addiction module antitoxin [uncultured Pseudomonas sp.]|uniref:HigA family addiction module antitoxin n=1 Tax=uncultured Pseudomonas sp. TaxID=114707 RepID=UPI0025E0E2CC|nr:HigA family addiction module antitoxin [uncultured Pseudomonas sp.]
MNHPPHPGAVLDEVLRAKPITIAAAAQCLGVSRGHLSAVVNGRRSIRAGLAQHLERAGLSTARLWLAMQAAHDEGRQPVPEAAGVR